MSNFELNSTCFILLLRVGFSKSSWGTFTYHRYAVDTDIDLPDIHRYIANVVSGQRHGTRTDMIDKVNSLRLASA